MNQVGNVKSAQRVFAILQTFFEEERALRAAEIARSIRAPISSCVALLSTMVDQGALFYDETTRSYAPTIKLRQLTDWLVEENPLEKRAIYFARRLYRELGTPIAVTRRAGLYVEWLYTLKVTKLTAGQVRPLCETINGLAVLTHMTDAEIREIVAAHNDSFGRDNRIDPVRMIERVRAARGAGYASGFTPLVPGLAAICFVIEDDSRGEEVLLTVQLPADELRHRERRIVDVARRIIPDLSVRSRTEH